MPHMLMQSNGQSASTLCSDRRETRPIASASRQRAATRGASRDAAAQMREAHATRSDTTTPMRFPVAPIPHIRKQQHDTRSRSASQSAARALRPARARAADRKEHASRSERRRAQHRRRQDTQTHCREKGSPAGTARSPVPWQAPLHLHRRWRSLSHPSRTSEHSSTTHAVAQHPNAPHAPSTPHAHAPATARKHASRSERRRAQHRRRQDTQTHS